MKKCKSVMAALLGFTMLVFLPFGQICAEEWYGQGEDAWQEDYQEYYYQEDYGEDFYEEDYEEDYYPEEEEEVIPDSYYYPIESNDIEGWPQGPAIESASAVVMDMESGTFLYSKQATEKQYPASITKIMTTLLLIENCNLDDTITFSSIVYDLEEGSSHVGIQPGEEMTLRDCAYAIMLASANDAANGVAEYIGGSISGFADLMNEKAAELGCVNTHFSNPHGLYSDDHYTCAYDMALIAQAAYANPTFREIVSTKEYTIPETNLTDEERSFVNHHQMLSSSSEHYREWCTGGKTGYTSQCLNTLVTYGEKDGMKLVSVVLRVNGSDKAYEESTEILNYAFDNFYEKKSQSNQTDVSFYDIMGLGYPGEASKYLSPAWKENPFENVSVNITLPNNAAISDITYAVTENSGSTRSFAYEYNGQPVGTSTGRMNSPIIPVRSVLQTEPDIASEGNGETTSKNNIQMEGFNETLDQAVEFIDRGYSMFMDFAQSHTIIVLAGGAVVMIFLIVLIIVLIFRSSADARIRKSRKQEEEVVRKREEEIDQMTTAEIEAELRAAMQQEALQEEEEAQKKAEEEEAARKEEVMEQKARETEQLVDELQQKRQTRISADSNKGDGVDNKEGKYE